MEFNEKLQQLRSKQGLTQEQLAEKLYVSRAAISKWESGRGYPSIDSLKLISKFFSITIDELLSGEELIILAENDKKDDANKLCNLIFSIFDMIAVLFIFLPFYGQKEGEMISAVSLISYYGVFDYIKIIYFVFLIITVLYGILEFAIPFLGKQSWLVKAHIGSLAIQGIGILFFVMSRQPYVAAFMFCFFAIKVALLIKQSQIIK